MNVTCAILCGGQGTRLRPIIGDLPKCLAPVAGRPFLCYILDHLENQGVKKVVLCTGYEGNKVKVAIGGGWVRDGLYVDYSHESSPLGTGGALKNALPLLDTDPVLVMNGDTYCNFYLSKMLLAYSENELQLTQWGYFRPRSSGVLLATKEFIEGMDPKYSLEKNIEWSFNAGEWMSVGPTDPEFLDIGTPEGYLRAESFLREQGAIK